jgi:hypothetical protein
MFDLDDKISRFRVSGGKRKSKMRSSHRSLSDLLSSKRKSKLNKKGK